MAASAFKQDMPPEGGYQSIRFGRIPARKVFTGLKAFAAVGAIHVMGYYMMKYEIHRYDNEVIEERSGDFATRPLIVAERDRHFLKEMRRVREEEERLMRDVPGWKVGHLFDEPVYKTIEPDQMVPPSIHEFFVHTEFKNFRRFWFYGKDH